MERALRYRLIAVLVMVIIIGCLLPIPLPFKCFILGWLGAAILALFLAPKLARFFATAFTNFIFCWHASSDDANPDDPEQYARSEEIFALLRKISLCVLALALCGLYWSAPILMNWPAIDSQQLLPPSLLPALIVGGLSALAWIFYLSAYFIPSVCRNLHARWLAWHYHEEWE